GRVSFQEDDFFACLRVPNSRRSILTHGENGIAVGAECHSAHPISGPLERGYLLALVGVPHFRRVVRAFGENAFAVGAVRGTHDGLFMSPEGEHLLPRHGIPDAHHLLTSQDNASAVGTPRSLKVWAFPVHLPLENGQLLPRLDVPHLRRHVLASGDDAFTVGALG